jgi:mannose-1-phosphate guanylyltransferase
MWKLSIDQKVATHDEDKQSRISSRTGGKVLREGRQPEAEKTPGSLQRWAVVLAGGDGVRLRSLTRLICGDDRPKQFCPLFGECTLLEQARQRAERSIRPEQIFFAVTKAHEDYFLRDLSHCPTQRVVQPCNKGTAPAILYTLLHISRIDRDATVAILPCDHYYSDEGLFTLALESAFEYAGTRPRSVVLLGAQPNAPEVEYGWIEVGATLNEKLFHVRCFHEKPPLPVAEHLLKSGSLWNTFVMVGHVDAFLEMARATVPGLVEAFRPAMTRSHGNSETRIPDSLYDGVSPTDFSRQILSPAVKRLVTLRLENIEWHDLGNPGRVLSTLFSRDTELPAWAKRWQAARETAGRSAPRSSTAVA